MVMRFWNDVEDLGWSMRSGRVLRIWEGLRTSRMVRRMLKGQIVQRGF